MKTQKRIVDFDHYYCGFRSERAVWWVKFDMIIKTKLEFIVGAIQIVSQVRGVRAMQ